MGLDLHLQGWENRDRHTYIQREKEREMERHTREREKETPAKVEGGKVQEQEECVVYLGHSAAGSKGSTRRNTAEQVGWDLCGGGMEQEDQLGGFCNLLGKE